MSSAIFDLHMQIRCRMTNPTSNILHTLYKASLPGSTPSARMYLEYIKRLSLEQINREHVTDIMQNLLQKDQSIRTTFYLYYVKSLSTDQSFGTVFLMLCKTSVQRPSVNIKLYPAISTFAVQICYANKFVFYSYQTNTLFVLDEYTFRTRRIHFSYYTNKLFNLRINFPDTPQLCTAEGADKYETGTNVTRTTKKTPLTTCMKGEE